MRVVANVDHAPAHYILYMMLPGHDAARSEFAGRRLKIFLHTSFQPRHGFFQELNVLAQPKVVDGSVHYDHKDSTLKPSTRICFMILVPTSGKDT